MKYQFLITYTLHKTKPGANDDRGLERETMRTTLEKMGATPVGETCWTWTTTWDIDEVHDHLSAMLRPTDDLFVAPLLSSVKPRGRGSWRQ